MYFTLLFIKIKLYIFDQIITLIDWNRKFYKKITSQHFAQSIQQMSNRSNRKILNSTRTPKSFIPQINEDEENNTDGSFKNINLQSTGFTRTANSKLSFFSSILTKKKSNFQVQSKQSNDFTQYDSCDQLIQDEQPSSSQFKRSNLMNNQFKQPMILETCRGSRTSQLSNRNQIVSTNKLKASTKGVRFRASIQSRSRNSNNHFFINNLATTFEKNTVSSQQRQSENKFDQLLNHMKKGNKYMGLTNRRANLNIKMVIQLANSPVLTKNSCVSEVKCFMTHYLQHNSSLLGKGIISKAKLRLKQIDQLHIKQSDSQSIFRYDAFEFFLKTISELNYDSHEVIMAFENLLTKYNYPISIKLMISYMGSYLYQLNSNYDKAESILKDILREILKYKLQQYTGVYLIVMVKLKANLLEWEQVSQYLMKLLAYAWLFELENLENWVYFQLSRTYFFLNQIQQCEFYKNRSQMSIKQPKSNIYRELIARQFVREVQEMRNNHKNFTLEDRISIGQLAKPVVNFEKSLKGKQNLKIQSQIKGIHEQCKIKHVKNLLQRMGSHKNVSSNGYQLQYTSRNYDKSQQGSMTCNSSRYTSSKKTYAGNPLLRTHESGLKNLNVYFRKNMKGKSLIGKNRDPKLYTFQNSSKNILVLKQMSRNILMQMKWFVSLNPKQNS